MNKNQKIALVVLALVIVIYMISVVLGLGSSSSSGSKNPAKSKLLEGLNSVVSSFAPRIQLNNLSCKGQSIDRYFTLDDKNKTCKITLDKGLVGDENFWKTDIVLSAKNTLKPDIYFLAKYTKKALDVSKPDKNCLHVDAQDVPSEFWLAIEMTPKKEGSIKERCWLPSGSENIIGLTVTGKSSVTLTCHGCDQEDKKSIILKFKP